MLQLLELLHSLVVFHPGHFQLGHFLAFELVQLLAQDHIRILQDGFHQREQHKRILRRFRVNQRDRFEQVQREHLIHREIVLQLHVYPQIHSVLVRRHDLDDAAIHQRPE